MFCPHPPLMYYIPPGYNKQVKEKLFCEILYAD